MFHCFGCGVNGGTKAFARLAKQRHLRPGIPCLGVPGQSMWRTCWQRAPAHIQDLLVRIPLVVWAEPKATMVQNVAATVPHEHITVLRGTPKAKDLSAVFVKLKGNVQKTRRLRSCAARDSRSSACTISGTPTPATSSRKEPLTYVAEQLGHKKPTTTLLYYAHWIPRGDKAWADRLEASRAQGDDMAMTRQVEKRNSKCL